MTNAMATIAMTLYLNSVMLNIQSSVAADVNYIQQITTTYSITCIIVIGNQIYTGIDTRKLVFLRVFLMFVLFFCKLVYL